MKRFYGLLMALMCLTFGQTLHAQCGSTTQTSAFDFGAPIGPVTGSNCGTVEITEFALVGAPAGGTGTASDPYVTPFTIKTCVDVLTFDEQTLNWLHSVMLNNQTDLPAGTVVSATGTGVQPTAGSIAGNPSGSNWIFNSVAYGAEPAPSTWPSMIQGVDGDGFEPFPGYYVDGGGTEVPGGDGNTRNNFGDSGNGDSGVAIATTPGGTGLNIENFTLDPFCFQIDVANDGSSAVQNFRPQFNLAGDGSTGAWTVPTFGCILAANIPTACGPNSDGTMFYTSVADAETNCGTATQTSTFDFGGTIGNVSGSSCGVMEITELGIVGAATGSGTAQDPYIAPFELKTCIDVKTFDENILNWLHSVVLNNQTDLPVGTVVSATGTGVQPTVGELADPADNGGATNWIFNPVAYGAEPDPSTWPLMVQGTSGDGFEPFPGYYADGGTAEGATMGDGDSANNFGDSGNGSSGGNAPTSTAGAFLGTETFALDPFCFSIMVGNDGTEDVRRFRPQFNMAGDGSTGNWTVPTFECLLAAFIPTECGPNDDGSVYYASVVDPENDCGTQNETVSADVGLVGGAITGAACGHMEVTEMGLVGTNAGSGTDADPYVVPFSIKTCVDVKTFDESLVNWIHSVFIRNRSDLPDGTTITATGTGAQPTAAETLDPTTNTGATEWIFVDVPVEPAMTTWAGMIQGADGDGFHPYSGYYCDGGPNAPEADGDTRNNFGDNGNGQSGDGAATPAGLLLGDETYTLEPFCFLINVAEDVDNGGGKFRPNFGMAGDGSTGAWTVPTLDCLLANYFPTECGPNNDGTFAYTTECPSTFTIDVNAPAVAGTQSVMSGTDVVTWDVMCADPGYLDRKGADDTDLVADMLWYDATGDAEGFVPNLAPSGYTVDVSCETESTNPANGLTFPVDCVAQPNQITCKNPELVPSIFDIFCPGATNSTYSQPDYNIPASIEDQEDCDAHTMSFFFPVYDYDRNAGESLAGSLFNDYHPDCAVVRNDVVILPVQPAIAPVPDANPCTPPTAELRSNNGAAGFAVCDSKAMTNVCTPGAATSDWTATWTAEEISTLYTGVADYAAAYSPVTTTVTTGCACPAILPSEFVSFDATQQGEVNLLEWTTATESNVKSHIIERSANGKDFTAIGEVAAQGDSEDLIRYTFEDANPLKNSYYRIRSLDFDGTSITTNIKVVQRRNKFDLEVTNVFPVPTSNAVTIEFDAYKTENVNIVVMDIFGKIIAQDVMETENSLNTYQLDLSAYNNGVYMVTLDNGTNRVTKRIIKQ